MTPSIRSISSAFGLLALLVFSGEAFGDPPSHPPKKKTDNSAVLDVLPGPEGTIGIRTLVKKFGLTYVMITIDHQTPQDPINVLIRFELPRMKSCPFGDPPEHPPEVEATWQAAPGADAFLPMNVWARNISRGKEELFAAAACESS